MLKDDIINFIVQHRKRLHVDTISKEVCYCFLPFKVLIFCLRFIFRKNKEILSWSFMWLFNKKRKNVLSFRSK